MDNCNVVQCDRVRMGKSMGLIEGFHMTTETIALLTILRDETQSRDVLARCDAEIARLAQPVTPRAVSNAPKGNDWDALVRAAVAKRFWTTPPPKVGVVIIRDGQEVRIK